MRPSVEWELGAGHLLLGDWLEQAPNDAEAADAYELASTEDPADPACRFDDYDVRELSP